MPMSCTLPSADGEEMIAANSSFPEGSLSKFPSAIVMPKGIARVLMTESV